MPLDRGIQPLLYHHNCAASSKARMAVAKNRILEREALLSAVQACVDTYFEVGCCGYYARMRVCDKQVARSGGDGIYYHCAHQIRLLRA